MASMTLFFIGTIKSFYFSEPSNATSCVENPPKDTAITISEATTTMAISDVNGNIAETMNDDNDCPQTGSISNQGMDILTG